MRFGSQPYRKLNGFGADFTTVATKSTDYASKATAIANSINSGGSQTEVGAISQSVKKSAGLAAGLLGAASAGSAPLLILGPVGGTILLVLGVVAGAAALVDAIFGSSKDKETLEKAGQYNQVNNVLRQQIQQIDTKTISVGNGLSTLSQALKSVGLSGINVGLGNYADAALVGAMATNEELKKALEIKTSNLTTLIDTFNKSVEKTYTAVTGKSVGTKYVLWTFLGLAIAGGGYLTFKKLTHKKI